VGAPKHFPPNLKAGRQLLGKFDPGKSPAAGPKLKGYRSPDRNVAANHPRTFHRR